jgi:hypothetical protein
MKTLNQLWAISGIVAALAFSGTNVVAQGGGGGGYAGGGGFGRTGGLTLTSPEQLQRQADTMRIALAVTNDDEWAVISPRLVKVIQLQEQVRVAAMASMLNGMIGSRGGGAPAGGAATGGAGGSVQRGLAALGVQADPNADALTKAIADEAPIAEVKTAMARVRAARKAKQAEMERAQADLLAVVSVRQEAILLSDGLVE